MASLLDECRYKKRVIVLTVHTKDGHSSVEDWPAMLVAEAIAYASGTALLADVASVDYFNGHTGKTRVFTSPAQVSCMHETAMAEVSAPVGAERLS